MSALPFVPRALFQVAKWAVQCEEYASGFSKVSYSPAKPMQAAAPFSTNPSVRRLMLDCYNVATEVRIDSDMTVLWWFVGALLMLLSFVLWLAGLEGREGVLRIGKATVAETRREPKTNTQPVRFRNVIVGLIGILAGLTIILMVAS